MAIKAIAKGNPLARKEIHPEKVVGKLVAENIPPVKATLPIVKMKNTMFGHIFVGFGLISASIK